MSIPICTSKQDKLMSFLQLVICKSLMMLLFFRFYLVTNCSTHTIFWKNFLVLKCAPVRCWMSFVGMPCLPWLDLIRKIWTWFVCIEISILNILSNPHDYLSHHQLGMVLYENQESLQNSVHDMQISPREITSHCSQFCCLHISSITSLCPEVNSL